MSEFKGTPGPWHVRSRDVGSVGTDSQMVHICMSPIDAALGMDNEDLANTNLIAAAPELLEALQLFTSKNEQGFVMNQSDIDKCKAAIAKALGQ